MAVKFRLPLLEILCPSIMLKRMWDIEELIDSSVEVSALFLFGITANLIPLMELCSSQPNNSGLRIFDWSR